MTGIKKIYAPITFIGGEGSVDAKKNKKMEGVLKKNGIDQASFSKGARLQSHIGLTSFATACEKVCNA